MNVDFAITTPYDWATAELRARSAGLKSPGTSKWAGRRTTWARAISSATIAGDASIREKYILYTGTQTTFADSYNSTNFRPTFGIESIAVDFKGTMGSTKVCTLSFKCWTKDDLEILEQLYMVPGISVIVEWGYSIDTDGQPVGPDDKFTRLAPMKNPYSFIMDIIIRNRKSTGGNYDGLVGIVTNFNYKLNESLGFDCEVELIAPGEMWLEQNMTNISKQCTSNDGDTIKKYSNLVFIFDALYKSYRTDESLIKLNSTLAKSSAPTFPTVISQEWEMEAREYDKDHRTGFGNVVGYLKDMFGATDHDEVYISWAYFVKQLNENINKYVSEKGDNVIADDTIKNPEISLAIDFIPVTILPKFCTLDPRICTFKNTNINLSRASTRYKEVTSKWQRLQDWVDVHTAQLETPRPLFPTSWPFPDINDPAFALDQINLFGTSIDIVNAKANTITSENIYKSGNTGFLNNIYLNTGFLRDTAIINQGEQLTIDDYLTKVLSEVNKATGDIWNLQYHVDENNPHIIHIYDANYTSLASRTKDEITPFKFSILDNPDLLLQTANVESKLVDGFKTLVLYGNSSDAGNNDTANVGMGLYSHNISDGWKMHQDINNPVESINQCVSPEGELIDNLDALDPEADLDLGYATLLDYVTDDSVASAKAAMAGYISWLNKENPETAMLLPRNQNILLPFNFGIKMSGFSGFIWGNAIEFDYLPSRYDDRIYFQITKIMHTITRENWDTDIETIMRLRPDLESIKNPVKSKDYEAKLANQKAIIVDQQTPGGSVQQTTTYAAESSATNINTKVKLDIQRTGGIASATGSLPFTSN